MPTAFVVSERVPSLRKELLVAPQPLDVQADEARVDADGPPPGDVASGCRRTEPAARRACGGRARPVAARADRAHLRTSCVARSSKGAGVHSTSAISNDMTPRLRSEKSPLERLQERIRTADRGWFFAAIAEKVIERRQAKGLSQRELAEIVGTTQSAIARLERGGRPPRIDTLLRIADALDCELVVDLEPRS